MRQIFKNYLATFIKNWLQTIGTILFILMMFAVVIGFLAAPLQIYAHLKSADNKNIKFNQVINNSNFNYNSEFLYKFLYDNETVYNQAHTSDGRVDGQGIHEVLREAGLNDNHQQLLSDVFKKAVNLDATDNNTLSFPTTADMYDAYAPYLKTGLWDFSSGALLKTSTHFTLGVTDDKTPTVDQPLVKDEEQDIQDIIQSIFNTEPDASFDGAMQSRGFAIINSIFTSSSFGKTATDLAQYMAGSDDSFVKISKAELSKNKDQLVLTTETPMNFGFNQYTEDKDGNIKYDKDGNKVVPFSMNDISLDASDSADKAINVTGVSAKTGSKTINIQLSGSLTSADNNTITITSFRNAKAPIKIDGSNLVDEQSKITNDAPGGVKANATQQFGTSTVDLMRMDMEDRGATTQDVYLISSQLFDATTSGLKPSDKYYSGSNMFTKMSQSEYSYNFLNYITRLAYLDSFNTNAFNGEKQNYNFSTENSMFFSQTSSSSLFPTQSIVLKTANQPNEPNQIQLVDGRLPKAFTYNYENRQDILDDVVNGTITPEIVINSGYAKHNNLKVGDLITLPDGPEHNNVSSLVGNNSSDDFLTKGIKYKIVGIGEKFDDAVPGKHYTAFMEDIKTYTNAYVDDGWFNILKEAMWNNSSTSSSDFETTIRVTNAKGVKADPVSVFNFNLGDKNANNGLYNTSHNPFVNYSDTTTMRSVNNTKIKVIVFIILGVAVLVLAFIFINFIITKELNETRRQIGIFKSFGYKISELSWIFAVKTFLTIFVGAVLGWVVSIAIQTWSAGNYMSSVMFHFDKVYAGAAFLVIIFIVIPVIFLAVSYIMTLFYLREPTLSLLSNGAKVKKGTTHNSLLIKHLAKVGKGFGYRLQQGFIKDSMGKFIVVQILFAIASLTFTLMFGAQDLMYGIANQGFAVLSKNANHAFNWQNQDSIDIPYSNDNTPGKYKLTDPGTFNKRGFNYVPYDGKQDIGQVLSNDQEMSDSRYRENYLIDSISDTFDIDKREAMEMLMPLDFFLVKDAGVSPDQLPDVVKSLEKNQSIKPILVDGGKTDLLAEAAEQDAKIPTAMASQEMTYHDYFLNWILSFRISVMPIKDTGKVSGVETITQNLRDGKVKYDLDSLRQYVNDWDSMDDNASKNPMKINMSDIITDPDTVKTQFNDTLFGLSDTAKTETYIGADGQQLKRKNNLYLADITKIITLELAETYAENDYNSSLSKATPIGKTPNGNNKYDQSDVVTALAYSESNSIWKDFSPNNMKYWGMNNNPLMASMLGQGGSSSSSSSSSSNGGGLSLSRMNAQTVSLIMGAAMLGYNTSIDKMPVITINQAFFNKDEESLFYNIPVTGITDSYDTKVSLFDFKDKDHPYGTYENSLTHKGVSDATYEKLAEDTGDPNSVYAVVPYVLAKTKNIHVGDKLVVSTDTKQKRSVTLDVIGINKSVTYSLSAWSMDVDYDQYSSKFFDPSLDNIVNTTKGNKPLFNEMVSNEPMMEGNINLSNISGSIDSMKFVGKDLAMSIDPGSSVFGSIFEGMVDFSTLLGSKIDAGYRLITNPNIASSSSYSSVDAYNILRAGVNNGINEVNNILIVFMVLVAVMLLIILVVVMNIIVEQATPIILTLKSLGYNQREINWITMGSYITGAIISFIVAYCVSLIVWNVFLAIAGELWHIYVFMTYSWKAPVITFLVVGAILAFGWYVSDRKVERIPLTLVTGFN